jgi:hypothetical protein
MLGHVPSLCENRVGNNNPIIHGRLGKGLAQVVLGRVDEVVAKLVPDGDPKLRRKS